MEICNTSGMSLTWLLSLKPEKTDLPNSICVIVRTEISTVCVGLNSLRNIVFLTNPYIAMLCVAMSHTMS